MSLNNLEKFKLTWTNILFLPDNPVDIGLDAAIWILSAATLAGLIPFFPFVLLPLLGWIIGVTFAVWYIPAIRLTALYRLALLVIGLFILI